jgi:hypothetical protein
MSKATKNISRPDRDPDLISLTKRLKAVERRFAKGEFSDTSYLIGPVLYQYPAMMVPALQGAVLDAVLDAAPNSRLLDPFSGSGTSLVEGISRSCPSVGIDVNPLAVVVSKAKLGPYRVDALRRAQVELYERISADRGLSVEVRFHAMWTWYRKDVAIALSRIRRSVEFLPFMTERRFFWVCLAETARRCSNSRLTTVKLHRRATEDLRRPIDTYGTFKAIVERNLGAVSSLATELRDRGLVLPGGIVAPRTSVYCADIRDGVPGGQETGQGFGIVLTSPPYGDNTTTVPYGQATYLAASWISGDDFERDTGIRSLANPYATDARSLGGSWIGAKDAVGDLREKSDAFASLVESLKRQKRDRLIRVTAFTRDLDKALGRIAEALSPGALVVMTVGNRTVGGFEVPTSEIASELLTSLGIQPVIAMSRDLPSRRRSASRNDRAPRMSEEWILVSKAGPITSRVVPSELPSVA